MNIFLLKYTQKIISAALRPLRSLVTGGNERLIYAVDWSDGMGISY